MKRKKNRFVVFFFSFFSFKIYEQKSDDDDNTIHKTNDHPEENIDDRFHRSIESNNPKQNDFSQ